METIWLIQKAAATGNWWLAASSPQWICWCITSCAEFFGKTSNHPGDSDPLQPIFSALWRLAFRKTKITFEMEKISDHWWDSGKYDRAAGGDWENCEDPRCLLWIAPCFLGCVDYQHGNHEEEQIFHTSHLHVSLVFLLPLVLTLSLTMHLSNLGRKNDSW